MDENRLTGESMTKVLVKVTEKDAKLGKWIHLCYIPEYLYEAYKSQRQSDLMNLNATLSRWVKEDFKKELDMILPEDIDTLKSLVRGYYKEVYPDVYLDQSTDRQGWLRVWITKKMKEDLNINGE